MWAKVIKRERNKLRPWVVRFDAGGGQREKSFRTRKEADDFRAMVDNDSRARIYVEPDERTTLADYYEKWIATHAVGEGSKRTYGSVFASKIKPALGNKPIGRVTRDDVRKLLLEDMPGTMGRNGKPLGQDTIKTARTLLVALFGEALMSGKVAVNPAAGIRLPNGSSERADFYMATRDELEALEGKLGPEWGPSVWLMRGCGLRPGEALGVRHVDIRGDVLRVERQRLQDGSSGPCKWRRDGQYRDVPLPAYVAEKIPAGTGDLFPAGRTDVYRDRFMRSAKAVGLPEGFHPHALRHAYASALLAAGVSLFEVSQFLGHRDIRFTASVYGHLVPSAASRARAVLDAEHERS
jgi:integrase